MLHSRVLIQSLLNSRLFLDRTPDVRGKVLEISTVEDFDNDALINMYVQKNQINSIVVSAPVEVITQKPYFKFMQNVDFTSASTTKLGDSIFEGNTNIRKVQLSASIKELGKRCFYASGIEEIVLDYITTFGDECFAYAPRIKSMSLGTKKIPTSFAQNAIGLQSLDFTVEAVEIGTSAFAYCLNLTTIPFSKIAIYGEQSFEYSGLTEFRFTKNTKKMLYSAFRYSNINNIVFDPDYNKQVSVTIRQFMGTLVTKVNFSKIDATSCLFMFAECQLLEEIYMDPQYVKVPTSFCENCHNLKKYTSIGAERVEERAFFNCRSLKECILPKAKTFLPNAFKYCEQLELDLSKATDIQGYAFAFCHNVNISNMKYTSGDMGIYAFCGCRGIEELVVNYSLGAGCFMGCVNLKKVTFGKNCNYITTMSFSNCTSLKEIYFNGFINTLEDAVFSNSSAIEVLDLTGVKSIMFYAFENSKVKSVILGDAEMLRYVFHNCFDLKKVTIGKTCTKFYPAAFSGLEDNIEFELDKDNKNFELKDGLLTNTDGTLYAVLPSYTSKTYTVPDTITAFTKHCFILAKNVEKLEINHFMTLNQQNFSYYLKELVINNPDKENKIILESFHLSGLQKVTLVDGVKLIDYYSFYQCYNLTNVTLNSGVLLKEGVFVECTKLEQIKLPDMKTTFQDFVDSRALFMHCTSLKSVEIPVHMIALSELMFSNTGLEEFIVPDQISSIGKYCFEACKNLKKLVLGKGILSLGKDLTYFVDDNLTLELSKYVRYIDPEAFTFSNNINVVIDNENPYYFVERNAVIERSSKTLITTFGKLPEIYRVPSSVEIVAEDAIKYMNDYFKTKEFMKFSNERPAMVVILPETVKEFRNPTNLWTTITVCYEGEYFQSTKITNIPNKYADKKKYLNPTMFGENVNFDCSQKLPDNWRHVIGKTTLEKNLIISTCVIAGLAVAAIVATIILFTLKSRKH